VEVLIPNFRMEGKDPKVPVSAFKVLAFGDSLTEGFYNYGFKFHSYAGELKRILDSALQKQNKEVLLQQVGVSGEYTSHMISRLGGYLVDNTASPYQLVCILGGTNDLALDDPPAEVAARLKTMYNAVLTSSTDSLLAVITIPQSYFLDPEYVSKRSAINSEIKEYCEQSAFKDRIVFVDLERLLPYYDKNGEKDTVHWDDHLHMSPDGYDQFGKLVADAVLVFMGDESATLHQQQEIARVADKGEEDK
jgi:lysophospholipase L1-like esterase